MSGLDVESRIYLAMKTLVAADTGVVAVCGARVYRAGDISHAAAYPAVTIGIPACACFDFKTGWYRAVVQLRAETHMGDDKSGSVNDTLMGHLRALCQTGSMEASLNATASALATATALTTVEAALQDSFEEKSQPNIRTNGLSLLLVVRPSVG